MVNSTVVNSSLPVSLKRKGAQSVYPVILTIWLKNVGFLKRFSENIEKWAEKIGEKMLGVT